MKRGATTAAVMVVCMIAQAPMKADQQPQPQHFERSVKAAFVCKFLSYVEWPAGAEGDPARRVVIGVLGAPEVLAQLQALTREGAVPDRAVEVRAVGPRVPLDHVHVLFVGRQALAAFAAVTNHDGDQPVLVITESPHGLRDGGIINFVVNDGRVRFEISLAGARRRGLRLRSHLLALAQRVVGEVAP